MGAVLLDTTVLIDALRGGAASDRVRSLRRVRDVPYTSAINIEEVTRGLRPAERQAASRLLSGLRVAPLGRSEGEWAGEWRRSFAARGITLSQADCLVAAAAAGVGARLATSNVSDFPMDGLIVEAW